MSDRKDSTLAERSEARRRRYEARAKLGLKPGDKREAHHCKGKGSSDCGYDNSKSNLKAVDKDEHMSKGNHGRPKGSKDSMPRKKRGS